MSLVHEGEYLVVYIPATSKALVFRVVSRVNKGYERFFYGPLPIPAGTPLPSYAGGVVTVPDIGVLPMTAYIPDQGITFPMPGAFDETDMWYIPAEWRNRLFHVITKVTPQILRVEVTIPRAVKQGRFQRDKITTGIEKTFGFNRGSIELIHFPEIHYGYRFGNDTNMNLYTGVEFTYGEYIVEIPKDPALVFDILNRRIPSKWITMPINSYDESIRRALTETYGFEGFILYAINERDRAIRDYNLVLKGVKI